MIRQIRNVAVPLAGSLAAQIQGPVYSLRISPPTGQQGLPGGVADAVWLTLVGNDGADDSPILVDPFDAAPMVFPVPLDGIRLHASGAVAAVVDLAWTTQKGDGPLPPLLGPASVTLIDNATAAAGAAYDSGALFTSGFRSVGFYINNAAGAVARDLVVTWYSHGGASIWGWTVMNTPAGSTRTVGIGDGLGVVATAPGAVFNLPMPYRIKATIAAAGAANVILNAWGIR